MVFRCEECGHLFEEGEQAVWYEDRGEYGNERCHEKMKGCPICNSEYSEAECCRVCGSYELEYGECYCNACTQDVRSRLVMLITENFSEEEIELLGTLYEELEL